MKHMSLPPVVGLFPKKQLESVLAWVLGSPYSSFYRSHFSGRVSIPPSITEEVWEKLPLLPRVEITSVSIWERIFVPKSEVPVIRHTYGTSGRKILMTPRSSYGDYTDPYVTMGMRSLMNFFAAAHFESPREHVDIQVLFGDVGNLDISAKMAALASVDSLAITPYTALIFAPLLKKYAALERIHWVMLIGERCSPLQFENIKLLYPNAKVIGVFASSETREIVALPCIHDRERGGSLILTQVPEMLCEIVEPESGRMVGEYDVCGELVITTLVTPIPFPLIRYRTGDIARYVKRECGCDTSSRGFEVLGRSSVFPVRMVKGELNIEAVERALAAAINAREYFEAHYFEEKNANGDVLPRVKVVLLKTPERDAARAAIAEAISENLFVFPTYTYAKGVTEGIYLPLELSFIDTAPPSPPGKERPSIVVRHISGSSTEEPYITSGEEAKR